MRASRLLKKAFNNPFALSLSKCGRTKSASPFDAACGVAQDMLRQARDKRISESPPSAAIISALVLLSVPLQAAEPVSEAESGPSNQVAVLRGLDKIGARVSTIEVRVGETVAFGTLEITAHYCRNSPPEAPPESKAFLEIDEIPPDEDRKRVFTGWMFASSPALSALEHPVYDVWVLRCRTEAADTDVDRD